jgi:hypothetical protein
MGLTSNEPIEIVVETELREEIAAKRRSLAQLDDSTFALQKKADAAQRKADKTGKDEDKVVADRLHHALVNMINQGTALSEQIRTLSSIGEIERRVSKRLATRERIGKMTDAQTQKKTKTPTAKEQGFPDVYLAPNGNFKIGLDASAKSDLVAAVLGLDTSKCRHVFTKAQAQKLIDARGWQKFVDRKAAIIAEKAEKAERRAQEKKDAEKAKAEAKAAAKTEAKAAPAATTDSNEVTPDPKPTPKPKRRGPSSK